MATPAQIRANRLNALRSSGPRTDAGRQITRFNALKHGLAGKELVIPGEDPAAFDAIRAGLVAEHEPCGTTETMLVEELAICWWRLQRARREEAGIISGVRQARQLYDSPVIVGLLRYTVAAERAWNRALANLRTAQNDRCKHPQDPAESAPSPQPQETEKVMAVGSVPQNQPAGPEPTPAPEQSPALATDHRPLTPGEIAQFNTRLNHFMASVKADLANSAV